MKHKKVILASSILFLLGSLAAFSLLYTTNFEFNTAYQQILSSIHTVSNNLKANLTLPQTNPHQTNNISPLTFLLLSSVGVAIVGGVSIAVLRMGPEKRA